MSAKEIFDYAMVAINLYILFQLRKMDIDRYKVKALEEVNKKLKKENDKLEDNVEKLERKNRVFKSVIERQKDDPKYF